MICCSVRVAEDNRAPAGRGGAPTRARHTQLYGRGRPAADCGVVQEWKAARVRFSADDSASRRTLLLEGTYYTMVHDDDNKYVIYPPPEHPNPSPATHQPPTDHLMFNIVVLPVHGWAVVFIAEKGKKWKQYQTVL